MFLPIGFVGGIVSQFFLPFGLTVTFALLASLLVRAHGHPGPRVLLHRKVNVKLDPNGELRDLWSAPTRRRSSLALRSRVTKWGTLGITFGLFIATMSLAPAPPDRFINSGGEKILAVTVAPPTGASTDAVLARAEQVEELLMADPTGGARPVDHPGRSRHRASRRSRRAPAAPRTAPR